jgi:hypothetical protein
MQLCGTIVVLPQVVAVRDNGTPMPESLYFSRPKINIL